MASVQVLLLYPTEPTVLASFSPYAMRNFVFGYGSLICRTSRSRTAQSDADVAIPVLVAGLQRVWSCRTPYRMTALGVTSSNDESSRAAGVLVPVTEAQLAKFDAREGDEYDRILVPLDRVETVPFLTFDEHYSYEKADHKIFLDSKQRQGNDDASSHDGVQIWVYQQKNPERPTTDYPIVQSYVDTILRGCLEIHEQFAVEFLKTTKGVGGRGGRDPLRQ